MYIEVYVCIYLSLLHRCSNLTYNMYLVSILTCMCLSVSLCLQVMVACFEVFQTWEDEYEKLQVLLRDIVKRKREENLKMVWRLSPAHRKLQSRLDHMRRFRRQHEQLRAVIVRVLRPQVIIPLLILHFSHVFIKNS